MSSNSNPTPTHTPNTIVFPTPTPTPTPTSITTTEKSDIQLKPNVGQERSPEAKSLSAKPCSSIPSLVRTVSAVQRTLFVFLSLAAVSVNGRCMYMST